MGIDCYLIPLTNNEKKYTINLSQELRMNGFNVDLDYMNRNLKSNFKQADRLMSKFIIIIGEEETKTNVLTIKNNITKKEYKLKKEDLINYLDENLGEEND